jgi:hypothetical protein
MALKPDQGMIVAVLTALAVVEIFKHTTPPTADISMSAAGGAASQNTFNSVKTATYESAALVVGVAVLARDPTVYVVGALAIVFEAWKQHAANVTSPGIPGQPGMIIAPGVNASGQAQPTLNGG